MTCTFNENAKKVTGAGGCVFCVGLITYFIIAPAMMVSGLSVELEGGSTSFTYDAGESTSIFSDMHDIYIANSETCLSLYTSEPSSPGVTIVHVETDIPAIVTYTCSPQSTADGNFEESHDPPLRRLGSFSRADDPTDPTMNEYGSCHVEGEPNTFTTCRKLSGDYRVTADVNVWMVNPGQEMGEAAGGLLAGLGIALCAYVCFIASFILWCVACCCCCQGPDVNVVVVGGTEMGGKV
jgi:hypothetical protein